MIQKIFPVILIVLQIAAAFVCLIQGNFKTAAYWAGAALVNYCATF